MKKFILLFCLLCLCSGVFAQNTQKNAVTYIYIHEKPSENVALRMVTFGKRDKETKLPDIWYFATGMENALKVKILDMEENQIICKLTYSNGSETFTITKIPNSENLAIDFREGRRVFKKYTE